MARSSRTAHRTARSATPAAPASPSATRPAAPPISQAASPPTVARSLWPSPTTILHLGLLAIAVAVPIAFTRSSNDAFELPKQALLRTILIASLALAAAAVVSRWWSGRSRRPPTADRRPPASDGGRGEERRLRAVLAWPPALAGLAVVAAWVAAWILSEAPEVSSLGAYQRWAGVRMQVAYVALFLAAAVAFTTRSQVRRLAAATALAALVVSLYAVSQRLGWDPFGWNWGELGNWQVTSSQRERPFSFFGNPNFLAAYLTLSFFLTLGAVLQAVDDWRRLAGGRASAPRLPTSLSFWLLSGALALQFVVLVLSRTRSAWVGTAAGLAAFGLLLAYQRGGLRRLFANGRWRRWLAGSLAAVALLGAGLWALFATLPADRLLGGVLTFVRVGAGTASVRLLLWEAAWLLTLERPLFGFGPDTLGSTLVRRYTPALTEADHPMFVIDRAHNLALDTLTTVGFVGLLALLAMAALVAWASWRLVRGSAPAGVTSGEPGPAADPAAHDHLVGSPFVPAMIAALAAHVVEQQFNLAVVGYSFLSWTLAGALAGAALGRPGARAPAEAALAGEGRPVPGAPTTGASRKRRQRRAPSLSALDAVLAVAVVGVVAATVWWELQPLRADSLYARGLLAERENRLQQAAELISQAIALWPREPAYWNELSKVRFELARRAQGDQQRQLYQQTVAAADEAVRLNPASGLLWSNFGLVAGEAGSRLRDSSLVERALEAHRHATSLAPGYWLYWRNQGATQYELADFAAAQQSFDRAIALRLNPDAQLWDALGFAAAAAGDQATAQRARERRR